MLRLLCFLLLSCFPLSVFAGRTGNRAPSDTAALLIVYARAGSDLSGALLENDTAALQEISPAPGIRTKENRKLIAALFALPPLGIVGLHRIYLRTAPYVPVVYLLTLGGALVLPLIDLAVILISDEEQLKEYENNTKIFMWMK